ncbi:MAG: hypothetical protein MSC31_03475 [Solirubrobacteraceae bacterium MAG38_C4-C5]|nr:hypothetical protein [Candidatus Siliceabacter maunaloa]
MSRATSCTAFAPALQRNSPQPLVYYISVRRLLLAALAALTALSLAAPAQAELKKKAIWGPVTLPSGESAFTTYEELGVEVFQIQVDWSEVAAIEPATARDKRQPSAYDWPEDVGFAVREAQEHGIEVALMLTNTPSWANGGQSPQHAPTDEIEFARFAQAASRKYPAVRFWMIWGEPNREGSFLPMPPDSPVGPRKYADVLDAAYVALKKQSRANRVIGGMTFTAGVIAPKFFIEDLVRSNGRPPRMDFYGHNPFTTRYPDLDKGGVGPGFRDMSDVDVLHRDVREHYERSYFRYRESTPRLWLSEFTVQADRTSGAFDFFVSRPEQALWLRKAYRIQNETDYIYLLGWFNLQDAPEGTNGVTTGLMTHEGEHKPSFDAYRGIEIESD